MSTSLMLSEANPEGTPRTGKKRKNYMKSIKCQVRTLFLFLLAAITHAHVLVVGSRALLAQAVVSRLRLQLAAARAPCRSRGVAMQAGVLTPASWRLLHTRAYRFFFFFISLSFFVVVFLTTFNCRFCCIVLCVVEMGKKAAVAAMAAGGGAVADTHLLCAVILPLRIRRPATGLELRAYVLSGMLTRNQQRSGHFPVPRMPLSLLKKGHDKIVLFITHCRMQTLVKNVHVFEYVMFVDSISTLYSNIFISNGLPKRNGADACLRLV
jgi:hypothetical protein